MAPVPGSMVDPVTREAMADPGTQEAMADTGTREAMAEQGAWLAIAEQGTREAMAGPPLSPHPQLPPRINGRSPTTPPKKSLGKVGSLSGWHVGRVVSWGRSGSTGQNSERMVASLRAVDFYRRGEKTGTTKILFKNGKQNREKKHCSLSVFRSVVLSHCSGVRNEGDKEILQI